MYISIGWKIDLQDMEEWKCYGKCILHPLSSRKLKNRFSFGIVGNYVYKVSLREFEKLAMGMGLSVVACVKTNSVLEF
jgi:hypothetical protein